ncbi:hypothetical protein F4604DRAFT_1278082 [Suillus subluteus]|nr:hypothetical protein F4604DRAFT_1278082 [Suillus subluteus]
MTTTRLRELEVRCASQVAAKFQISTLVFATSQTLSSSILSHTKFSHVVGPSCLRSSTLEQEHPFSIYLSPISLKLINNDLSIEAQPMLFHRNIRMRGRRRRLETKNSHELPTSSGLCKPRSSTSVTRKRHWKNVVDEERTQRGNKCKLHVRVFTCCRWLVGMNQNIEIDTLAALIQMISIV